MTTANDKQAKGTGFNPLSRDNIEALTMAIIMAVMLKYFIVEAYKIPTGSMQPTLLGNEDTGIFDRIIVDKLSYHYRDPERWEVTVFKYPLDRSKNFIKRLCGMPGEDFQIADGDLWTRPDERSEWKILRRPRPIQQEVWKRINPADPRYLAWKPIDSARGWSIDGRSKITARGDGAVRLPADGATVLDMYSDGYPSNMGSLLSRARTAPGLNACGDLRLSGEVAALAGTQRVVVELTEGSRRYSFELPGPAADANARPKISAALGNEKPVDAVQALAEKDWKLTAGKRVSFAVQNMDDLLQLEIDGDIVATLEIPRALDQTSSYVLRVEGEGADFEDVEIWRDIYYTTGTKGRDYRIPPGHYVMLGDNTLDSHDSREWMYANYSWSGPGSEGREVRGQWYDRSNPVRVNDAAGPRIFFRDEWGELHDFMEKDAKEGARTPGPFVPRNLITGRAVIVFWPLTWIWPGDWGNDRVPKVTRLRWIH
ncbi:MAG: signal peptidase I [Planctomycetes bacterium]|nr:signal peptidase I [Planctomycetota bacterium]